MVDIDTEDFIKEREERLGAPLTLKTYCTFFADNNGEKREYGVFLYSDGRTLVLEDFERIPSLMGIPLTYSRKNQKEYVKLEVIWSISDILSIDRVTRASAESSCKKFEDSAKPANAFDKIFKKLVTRIRLKDGRTIYLEMISHKDFVSWVDRNKKEQGE